MNAYEQDFLRNGSKETRSDIIGQLGRQRRFADLAMSGEDSQFEPMTPDDTGKALQRLLEEPRSDRKSATVFESASDRCVRASPKIFSFAG